MQEIYNSIVNYDNTSIVSSDEIIKPDIITYSTYIKGLCRC